MKYLVHAASNTTGRYLIFLMSIHPSRKKFCYFYNNFVFFAGGGFLVAISDYRNVWLDLTCQAGHLAEILRVDFVLFILICRYMPSLQWPFLFS